MSNESKVIISFPDPEFADPDGFLAIGGNLEPSTLLTAYASGIFPWSVRPITWWSPDPRAIFEINQLQVSRRMHRYIKSSTLKITFDQAFVHVMKHCAKPAPGRESSWISPEFIVAYERLFKKGYAHSVEAWRGEKLVGGVYGISLGGFFAGESMFHFESNASTICLYHLMQRLQKEKYELFDSQVITPHTRQMGAIEITRSNYLRRLACALKKNCKF